MRTNPTGFNSSLQKINKEHRSLIKPTIRLLKHWNVASDRPLESFETEKFVCGLHLGDLSNLRDYFFAVIAELSAWNADALWINSEIRRAKAIVATVKAFEKGGQARLAEEELQKLFQR